MSEEYKLSYFNSFRMFNRMAYGVLIVATLLLWASGLTQGYAQYVYFFFAFFVMIIGDEIVFRKNRTKLPKLLLEIRFFAYPVLLSVGCSIRKLAPYYFAAMLLLIFFFILQNSVFCDIFNTYTNNIKRAILGIVTGLLMFIVQFRSSVNGVWFLIPVIVILVYVGLIFFVYYVVYRIVMHLDERYTKLYFKNADMISENKKLLKFQERVEKVNNEINYQKINLTKANDDLAKINEETRSLIEVMKYFTASFNVENNAHYMLENVVNIKETGAAALYLDKDVYMNEEPYLEIISENSVAETLLKQDIESIYDTVKKRKSMTPLVLCENYDFKYPYLTGTNLCNAVVFPAYENENVYGIMVITSSKYDFFENGYAFYESSIMDFTSALISDRLYLQTEDMAKKDGLTKIYNRIYFNQFYPKLLEEVSASGDVFTVVMLDIDHFKRVNDTYGHLAGDEVIKAVAKVDNDFAKKYNGTAVRYGGEEFLLILREKGVEETHAILKEMHQVIKSNVVEFEDYKIQVNSSIGLACYPETCDDIHEVLDRSDKAMYYSKEHGRGRITIDGREGE
ncbi:MAG: GGDEF domain-containing protein [Eubacterium sp.]|nr:GGDEF domain-containing protein [Eubacterium sp.]